MFNSSISSIPFQMMQSRFLPESYEILIFLAWVPTCPHIFQLFSPSKIAKRGHPTFRCHRGHESTAPLGFGQRCGGAGAAADGEAKRWGWYGISFGDNDIPYVNPILLVNDHYPLLNGYNWEYTLMGMSENGVYPQWNSHLVGIMISKTIGCRGVPYFQTNPYREW